MEGTQEQSKTEDVKEHRIEVVLTTNIVHEEIIRAYPTKEFAPSDILKIIVEKHQGMKLREGDTIMNLLHELEKQKKIKQISGESNEEPIRYRLLSPSA